jgi:homoserine O-succinyltransferase
MPIKLPAALPAYDVLSNEGVMVLDEDTAARQDIRPLRIALLNLMPKKIQTENQFARLIGATPLQIELSLLRMSEHQTKNTAAEHMEEFYRPFSDV